MVRHLQAPFQLNPAYKPIRRQDAPDSRGQAVVFEPCMAIYLEGLLPRMLQEVDWRTTIVASARVLLYGCVRFCHMQRAIPLRRNEHIVTFETYRGKTKQDGERAAFVWHVPRTGRLGHHFADIVWDSFRRFHSPA
eukprot:5324742-Amphidinium_carterae.1